MKIIELQPCPFCGAQAPDLAIAGPSPLFLSTDDRPYMVFCPCGATGPAAAGYERAAELWNIRALLSRDLLRQKGSLFPRPGCRDGGTEGK